MFQNDLYNQDEQGGEQPSSNRKQLIEKQKQNLLSKQKLQQGQQMGAFSNNNYNNLDNHDKEIDNYNNLLKQDNGAIYEPGQKNKQSNFTLQKIQQVKITQNDTQGQNFNNQNNVQYNQQSQNQFTTVHQVKQNVFQEKKNQDNQGDEVIDELILKHENYLNNRDKKNVKDEEAEQYQNDQQIEQKKEVKKISIKDDNSENSQDQQIQSKLTENQSQKMNNIQLFDTMILESMPDLKTFLSSPIPKGKTIQLQIKRDKSGLKKLFPKFLLFTNKDYRYLCYAKKKPYNKTSNYGIYYENPTIQKEQQIGKVRSNFLGTEFHIFDDGDKPSKKANYDDIRRILCACQYEQNLFGSKGPRKIKIFVPEIMEDGNQYPWRYDRTSEQTIMQQYRCEVGKFLKLYQNKPPKWNEYYHAYVLNFNGRVDKPSVKNFQLIDELDDDHIYLQFGRQGEDLFSLDFTWPFSPIQAFGIAMSSFDYKIVCE